MVQKKIGQRIAEVREARGLSQSELARRLGVKPQAVQKWEAGGAPRTHRIEAIANVLETTVRNLVDNDENATSSTDNGWPFKSVDRADFDSLPASVRADIEDYIHMKVTKAKAAAAGKNKSAA